MAWLKPFPGSIIPRQDVLRTGHEMLPELTDDEPMPRQSSVDTNTPLLGDDCMAFLNSFPNDMPMPDNFGDAMPAQESTGYHMPSEELTGNELPSEGFFGNQLPSREESTAGEGLRLLNSSANDTSLPDFFGIDMPREADILGHLQSYKHFRDAAGCPLQLKRSVIEEDQRDTAASGPASGTNRQSDAGRPARVLPQQTAGQGSTNAFQQPPDQGPCQGAGRISRMRLLYRDPFDIGPGRFKKGPSQGGTSGASAGRLQQGPNQSGPSGSSAQNNLNQQPSPNQGGNIDQGLARNHNQGSYNICRPSGAIDAFDV